MRTIPNAVAVLQFLLDDSVLPLQTELQQQGHRLSECIALDTKHIVAWVKESNPKAYVANRFDKEKQPAGDPDRRLGCKRRYNQSRTGEPPTPHANPVPAATIAVGEFYWGYASGVVATKIPECGEFVLTEWTQPFDYLRRPSPSNPKAPPVDLNNSRRLHSPDPLCGLLDLRALGKDT